MPRGAVWSFLMVCQRKPAAVWSALPRTRQQRWKFVRHSTSSALDEQCVMSYRQL